MGVAMGEMSRGQLQRQHGQEDDGGERYKVVEECGQVANGDCNSFHGSCAVTEQRRWWQWHMAGCMDTCLAGDGGVAMAGEAWRGGRVLAVVASRQSAATATVGWSGGRQQTGKEDGQILAVNKVRGRSASSSNLRQAAVAPTRRRTRKSSGKEDGTGEGRLCELGNGH